MKVQVKFVKVKEPQKWDSNQSCYVDIEGSKDYEFVIVKEGFSYINGIKIKKEFYHSLKRPLLPQEIIEIDLAGYPKKLYNLSQKNGKYYETIAFIPTEVKSIAPVTITTAEPSTMD